MNKLYNISVSFTEVNNSAQIEKKLSVYADDWLRYANDSWLVSTSITKNQLYNKLKSSITLADNVLIFDVDVSSVEGYMPKPVWEWISKHKTNTVNFGNQSHIGQSTVLGDLVRSLSAQPPQPLSASPLSGGVFNPGYNPTASIIPNIDFTLKKEK